MRNTVINLSGLILAISMVLLSCSRLPNLHVEKRKYQKGFYISLSKSTHKTPQVKHTINTSEPSMTPLEKSNLSRLPVPLSNSSEQMASLNNSPANAISNKSPRSSNSIYRTTSSSQLDFNINQPTLTEDKKKETESHTTQTKSLLKASASDTSIFGILGFIFAIIGLIFTFVFPLVGIIFFLLGLIFSFLGLKSEDHLSQVLGLIGLIISGIGCLLWLILGLLLGALLLSV